MNYFSTFSTPFGDFSVAVDEAGAVVATAFGSADALLGLEAAGLQFDAQGTAAARKQLIEYFFGWRNEFDLPLAPRGTPFQQRVWTALREIPPGETRSYGDLARRLGSSPRAIGRAVGANPVCIIVPCHRVIGANGSLTGFAFGQEIKRRLLELEGVLEPALI
ncbi:MAG: methylated-DNA--[protein]-cysteine S-methyltransferase [Verrucomicrobiota bacterium]|nr:methylated-DNA--[protein]-cysteine S-methyltransferase [Verrucomicrobiota bacterium]